MIEPEIGRTLLKELPEVIELLERAGLPGNGLADIVPTLRVARREGRIVGSAGLEVYDTAALLRSVAVDAEARNHGLGRRLVLSALDLARERGVKRVFLLTETAEGFFHRLGFESIDRSRVPASVKVSVEFTTACPETAQAMEYGL